MVSVIVPVHNCQEFLPRCIRSLQNQSCADCQFIFIDDGSTDSSLSIINGLTQGDNRFIIISQPNSGVAAARNVGLGAATGDYIAFVDADDYVSPSYIESLLTAMESCGADIAMCDYDRVYKNHIHPSPLGLKAGTMEGLGDWWLRGVARSPELWNKLYRRSVILSSGAVFQTNCGEDLLFNLSVAVHVHKAVTLDQCLYHYVQRRGSVMRSAEVSAASFTLIDAFADRLCGNEVYINLGPAFMEQLCAFVFISFMHSSQSFDQPARFFKSQLAKLSVWDGYRSFCKAMASGRCMQELCSNGSVGKKFAALMRMVFLPASMGFQGLTAAGLSHVRSMITKRTLSEREELF